MDVFLNEHFQELVKKFQLLPEESLICIEGFSGSGKSTLACQLAKALVIPSLSTDCFIKPQSDDAHYPDLIDLSKLKNSINEALSGSKLIVEGICLQEILEQIGREAGFRIYIKKLSKPSINGHPPCWEPESHMAQYQAGSLPYPLSGCHASDMSYHCKYQPHQNFDYCYSYIAA